MSSGDYFFWIFVVEYMYEYNTNFCNDLVNFPEKIELGIRSKN